MCRQCLATVGTRCKHIVLLGVYRDLRSQPLLESHLPGGFSHPTNLLERSMCGATAEFRCCQLVPADYVAGANDGGSRVDTPSLRSRPCDSRHQTETAGQAQEEFRSNNASVHPASTDASTCGWDWAYRHAANK